jgi:hypothetical protein
MLERRTVVLILAAIVLLGGQTLAHAQAAFGKPVTAQPPDAFGLTPPTREQLFRVQSEKGLQERLRQELPQVKKVDFPKDAPGVPEVPELAPFAKHVVSPIASQVCYRPLYFEVKRTERFGEYVPCVQPLMSAGRFYGDVLLLPFRMCLTPPWTFECDNR